MAATPLNRAQRRAMTKHLRASATNARRSGIAVRHSDPEHIESAEILLSQRTGDELDYEAAREYAEAKATLQELKEVDSRFELVFARPNATALDAGYWYIVRRNDVGAPSYFQVATPEGRPCAPGPEHVRRMLEKDTSRVDVYDRLQRTRAEERRQRHKENEERHRQFREQLLERLDHLYGVRISVPTSLREIEARARAESAIDAARAEGTVLSEGGVVLPDTITAHSGETAAAVEAATPPSPGSSGGGEVAATAEGLV